MKANNQLTPFSTLLTGALLAVCAILPFNLRAGDAAKPVAAARTFASPEDAQKALQAAAASGDRSAMDEIFGSQYKELLTGDAVQDANHAKKFATALDEACKPVKEGDGKITFEIGTNSWPFPIPLVKADGQWHFDTAAGKEEIINRHIGKDELHAIGVCRAYVAAQKKFADMNPKVGGGPQDAQKFKSSEGKKDGLYWPAAGNEPASPFGPLVAEAHAEGYGGSKGGTGLHAFHGYYFHILTRQGKGAPGGKMDYLSEGVMSGGFALVAYPEQYGKSGIMTFIVGQDGQVFQRDLGEDTTRKAAAMKAYNPGSEWTLVKDEGVTDAVMEK